MSIHKRSNRTPVTWYYEFPLPGSTRENRQRARGWGFLSKKECQDAETARRIEEQQKYELAKAGKPANSIPKSLGSLIDEFMTRYADQKLGLKTAQRYRELSEHLDPELLLMNFDEVRPLHFNHEWDRLLICGGHTRNKTPRPLSKRTVRAVARVASSVYTRAIKWGLATVNPVRDSEPPIPEKRIKTAILPSEQKLLIDSATSPWCLGILLETSAALGCRRGEGLALRWSDIQDGRAIITRSLSQTRQGLFFKGTKQDAPHIVKIPESTLKALEEHRKRQDIFREEFGSDYRHDLDLIFANENGSPLKPDSISATVSHLCKKLKLPRGVSLHTLRHTHGSHLLAAGVELIDVSQRLGHANIRVTAEVYSHALRGRDDEAAKRWDEFQLKNNGGKEGDKKNVV